MHQNKITILFLCLLVIAFSCIKPFDPELEQDITVKYVVSGLVTDNEGYQMISFSRTSPVDDPKFIPVDGAVVNIIDSEGNIFPGEEMGNGDYRVWIGAEYLVPGHSFKISIVTSFDEVIESDFETMQTCPEIDSLYHIREDLATNDPESPRRGIQFYTDFDGTGTDSRFFRWEVEETWEYHVPYPRQWYYDGSINRIDPPDYSRKKCWYTNQVKDIFDLSTQNLTINVYNKFPLHFVDNSTSRLSVLYSISVTQYSLTEAAYTFWDEVRINSAGQGGLYSQQPLAVKGNLSNITNPEKIVLGFFSVSSVKAVRIFIQNVENLEVEPYVYCDGPVALGPHGWGDFYPADYPVYFIYVNGSVGTLSDGCVDCLIHGGTTEKPVFWPN